MAKSHRKKGKKHRAKTTLPPVKDGPKQNGPKTHTRSVSIPPANQQKQHRKKLSVKKGPQVSVAKNGLPPPVGAKSTWPQKSVPSSTSITDAFSKLNITGNEKPKEAKKLPKRRFSTDIGNGKNGPKSEGPKRLSLENIAELINSGKAKNIVVMAGAGISTGSGIPDFRTPGTGLYDNLKKYRIPSPTAIFDLEFFHYDPKPFFTLAKELYPSGKYKPCLPHYFVKLLHDKGLLLRMYTQNIDGLERISGIPSEKLVEAHGTFSTASCTRCGKKHDGLEVKNKVLSGIIPRCNSSGLCWGIVKPDIVFFGEDLPRRFYYYLRDFPSCDLLIIMGTSLEVEPFASLMTSVRSSCPRVLLNRELVGPFKSRGQRRTHDVGVTGDLAESINRFATLLGWKDELDDLIANSKAEETAEEKSESGSCDSGISSESSSNSSRGKPTSLLPPDNNIKRYFHTIRSTPLPKANSTFFDSSRGASYYNYIKDRSFSPATQYSVKNTPPGGYKVPGNSSLAIQYAQTVPGKKRNKALSCGNIRTFGMQLQKPKKAEDSSSSESSSDEQSSESLSSLTSDDSSS